MGQLNRPMAQLRISSLYKLPIPLTFNDPKFQRQFSAPNLTYEAINELVYGAYRLNDEEIRYVEERCKDITVACNTD